MATDLVTPSNTSAKVRWFEPYVSEGLNKKFNGVIPPGVVRGGRLITDALNMHVTIEADPNSGDSIYSFIDATGHHISFRQTGDVSLDLTSLASTTVYIGLQITYSVSVDTVVKWRAFSLAEVQADPTLVILGRVDVPASGLIPASDIYPEERREAWMSISPGINKWRQVITGGSFEDCRDIAATSNGEQWPDWDLINSNWLNVNLSVTDSEARTGRHSLHVNLTGSATQTVGLYWAGMAKVFPGQLIRASVRVKGSSLSPGPSGGECGIILRFWGQTGSIPLDVLVSDDSLSGTFDWTEISFMGEIPSGVASLQVIVRYEDGNSSTGDIYFDDVRVWLERGDPLDEYPGENRDEHYSASTRSLTIDIPREVQNLATLTEEMIRMRQKSPISSVLQLLMGARDLSTEFLMTLQKGGLSVENLIEDIGSLKIGTAANAALPRVSMGCFWDYTLIFEFPYAVGGTIIRVYRTNNGLLSGDIGIVITNNAEWLPGTSQWQRNASADSSYVMIGDVCEFYYYPSASPSPWPSADWSAVGDQVYGFSQALANIKPDLRLHSGIEIDNLIDSLGGDKIGSKADAAEARITTPFPLDTVAEYTLLWEMGASLGRSIRFYVSYDELSLGQSFIITINASWDGSSLVWRRDSTTDDAIRFQLAEDRLVIYTRDVGAASSWTDANWDDGGTNSEKTFEFLNLTEKGLQTIADGLIKFLPATSIGLSNIDYDSVSLVANALYAKNIVKAWGVLETGGGGSGPTVLEGFNIASTSWTTAAFAQVNYTATMDNNYAPPILAVYHSSTTKLYVGVPISGSNGFGFSIHDETGNIVSDIENTLSAEVYFVVLGKQVT